MALQSSGAISITDIRTELGSSSYSLRTLSAAAGFSIPDAMSEFYGYSGVSVPSVTTNAASSVGVSTVTLNGNVTSDGGATVTARGFYFGTNSNVTSNPTYGSGSGTGAFSLARTGLSSSTTYYFAAYATNSGGTAVGSTLSFTTQTPVTLSNVGLPFQIYTDSPMVFQSIFTFNSNTIYTVPYPCTPLNGYFESTTYHQSNHPNYGWTSNYSFLGRYGTDPSGNNYNVGSAGNVASGNLYHKGASGYSIENRSYVGGLHVEYLANGNSQYGSFCRVFVDNAGYVPANNAVITSSTVVRSTADATYWGGLMAGDWNQSAGYLGGREPYSWSRTSCTTTSYLAINRSSYSYYLVTV